jgi:outer membrane immunogenic protein
MKQTFVAALIASLALIAGSARAADIPRGAPAPQPDYYSPAPIASWQGFYAGVNAGYGWGSFTDGGETLLGSPSGGLIGVTVGYNFAVSPNLVLGVEGDFDFSGMKTSQFPVFGVASSSSVDDLFTLRARVGYTMDRLMLFVTGGFAGSRNTATVSNAFSGFYGQQSKFQTGWALGAGAEYMLTRNLSAKAEYIYTSVGSDRYFDFSPGAIQTSANTSMIRGGLNYHF